MAISEGWYPDPSVPLKQRYWTGKQWTSRVVEGEVGVAGAIEKEVPVSFELGDPKWFPQTSVNPVEDLATHSWRKIVFLFLSFVAFSLALFSGIPQGTGVWDTSMFGGGRGGPWLTAFWLGQASAQFGSFIFLYNFRRRRYKLWMYVALGLIVDAATIFFYWLNRAP